MIALCPSRLYTKYSKQIQEAVGGDFRGGGKHMETQPVPNIKEDRNRIWKVSTKTAITQYPIIIQLALENFLLNTELPHLDFHTNYMHFT